MSQPRKKQGNPDFCKPHNYNSFLGWLSISVLWAWSKPLVNGIDATPQGSLTSGLKL
ncbi:MAG: hypothetical protein HWQ38_23705 [Nostoc sp. NMS7]|uniref:hypothetical protein n=1 Tax=Nostoc sp. NMS7 TaxID=2815391 RepID=UPI0025E8D4D2|nr:hypothetical protein [Nostoc sp. NMS7]MBN3949300.1 hypothetical protein [Nostoc sp. NMS7]